MSTVRDELKRVEKFAEENICIKGKGSRGK